MSEEKKRVRVSKKKIYCGDKSLPNGYKSLGTRFRCLQLGFGVGAMLERKSLLEGKTKTKISVPTEEELKGNFKKKIYCGYKSSKDMDKEKYNAVGTRNQCLRKGVGSGIYTEHASYQKDKAKYLKEASSKEAKRG